MDLKESENKRAHNRVSHRPEVRVTDEQGKESICYTRDLSHGGLFISLRTETLPEFGEKVTVQTLDIEDAMVNRATVVRVEVGKGIAVEFTDD